MRKYLVYRLFLSFVFVGTSSTLWSQEKTSEIILPEKVQKLLERKKELNLEQFNSQYYAIQLYYGDYNAVTEVLNKFKGDFPDWETELTFETPNYKVRVGRFKNLNIANQKLEEIRKVYPNAFLLEPNNL